MVFSIILFLLFADWKVYYKFFCTTDMIKGIISLIFSLTISEIWDEFCYFISNFLSFEIYTLCDYDSKKSTFNTS
jgi:hypothetical protein